MNNSAFDAFCNLSFEDANMLEYEMYAHLFEQELSPVEAIRRTSAFKECGFDDADAGCVLELSRQYPGVAELLDK